MGIQILENEQTMKQFVSTLLNARDGPVVTVDPYKHLLDDIQQLHESINNHTDSSVSVVDYTTRRLVFVP